MYKTVINIDYYNYHTQEELKAIAESNKNIVQALYSMSYDKVSIGSIREIYDSIYYEIDLLKGSNQVHIVMKFVNDNNHSIFQQSKNENDLFSYYELENFTIVGVFQYIENHWSSWFNGAVSLMAADDLIGPIKVTEEDKKNFKRFKEMMYDPKTFYLGQLIWRDDKKENKMLDIKKIYVNEAKRTVAVRFSDDIVCKSKCSEDDEFDVYVGVALCVVQHQIGSKTAFKKFVDKKLKKK